MFLILLSFQVWITIPTYSGALWWGFNELDTQHSTWQATDLVNANCLTGYLVNPQYVVEGMGAKMGFAGRGRKTRGNEWLDEQMNEKLLGIY